LLVCFKKAVKQPKSVANGLNFVGDPAQVLKITREWFRLRLIWSFAFPSQCASTFGRNTQGPSVYGGIAVLSADIVSGYCAVDQPNHNWVESPARREGLYSDADGHVA
jgi:hypothetical protein